MAGTDLPFEILIDAGCWSSLPPASCSTNASRWCLQPAMYSWGTSRFSLHGLKHGEYASLLCLFHIFIFSL